MSQKTARLTGVFALAAAMYSSPSLLASEARAESRHVQVGTVSPKLSFQTRRVLANPQKYTSAQRHIAIREQIRARQNQRILVERLKSN